MQLSVKYRPKSLKTFVGQDAAKAVVESLLAKGWPGAVLISGSTGSGKTTLARIIAKELESQNCCEEINIGDSRGIDDIRQLAEKAKLAPFASSKYRIFILDEVHMLTSTAASALLKVLEEPCKTTKFILCTDQPEKLLKTILGRCVKIQLKTMIPEDFVPYLKYVCKKEEVKISEDKLLNIAQLAGGQPRESLQMLELALANPKADLSDLAPQAFGNAGEVVGKLIYAAIQKDYAKVLEAWSYLEDKKAACKTLVWTLEYCMSKFSKAKVNTRWCWFSYDKQKVFEYLSKQATYGDIMPQLVSLYSRLASVLVLERETTQLEYKLLSVLLGEK